MKSSAMAGIMPTPPPARIFTAFDGLPYRPCVPFALDDESGPPFYRRRHGPRRLRRGRGDTRRPDLHAASDREEGDTGAGVCPRQARNRLALPPVDARARPAEHLLRRQSGTPDRLYSDRVRGQLSYGNGEELPAGRRQDLLVPHVGRAA